MKKEAHMTKDEIAADKMIKEMQDAGMTPDDMLRIIRMARRKYLAQKAMKP